MKLMLVWNIPFRSLTHMLHRRCGQSMFMFTSFPEKNFQHVMC